MNPASINRRGPVRNPAVGTGASKQTTSSVRTPPSNKAPPVVRYNTLTTERIIATWKVKRDTPTQDINFPAGAKKPGGTTTNTTPRIIKNYLRKETLENQKTSTEVQKTVIETCKERKTPIKSQETVKTVKKETSVTKPKVEVKRTGSTRKAANANTKEEKPKNEEKVNQVRSVVKAFEKNTAQRPKTPVPKTSSKEEPKKIAKEESKVVAEPKTTPKEVKTVKKTEEMIVVPIKKPSINVQMKPWSADSVPKDIIITTSVRPSLKKAQSRDQIINENQSTKSSTPTKEVSSPKLESKSNEKGEIPNIIIHYDTDDSARNSLEDQIDYNHPRAIDLAKKDARTLWKDIPAVKDSGILEKLTKDQRNKQEAKFEVMYSEASYLTSLNLLKNYYMKNIKAHVPQVLKQEDYNELFLNVLDVRKCSEDFLKELNDVWQNDIMLNGIYEIIKKYSNEDFKIYVRYCRKMLDMQQRLEELMETNEGFKNLLQLLVSRQESQKLSLNAFLTSPMQRITKLPLLMKTILDKSEAGSDEYNKCQKAYEAASKIAQECNDVIDENKKVEELLRLSQKLDFPADVRSIPIVVPNRHIVAKGDVKHFAFKDRSAKKEKLRLILFTDLLLIVKKKIFGEKQLIVVDHCPRDKIRIKEMENLLLYRSPDLKNSNTDPLIITMLNNAQNKKTDLMVVFKDPEIRKEWLQYLSSETEPEDETDVKQVITLEDHEAGNPNELSFSPGDVIHVLGDEIHGWCQGELLSDGSTGKFPVSKTAQITSPKIRAANTKTRKDLRQSRMSDDFSIQ